MRRWTSDEMRQLLRETRHSPAFSPISRWSWHSGSGVHYSWLHLTGVERARQRAGLVTNWNRTESSKTRGDTLGKQVWFWHRLESTGWNVAAGFLTFRRVQMSKNCSSPLKKKKKKSNCSALLITSYYASLSCKVSSWLKESGLAAFLYASLPKSTRFFCCQQLPNVFLCFLVSVESVRDSTGNNWGTITLSNVFFSTDHNLPYLLTT